MQPLTFIFFGSSGAGKGTQAKLLIEYLKTADKDRPTLYIETGERFREFMTEASFTALRTKEAIDAGELLPEFLPIWIWTEYFVRHVSGDEHLILDGLSRRAQEAPILDSAMRFYKRNKPFVIFIDVSRDWAKKHLLARGRGDDIDSEIEPRLDWFEKNVIPAMQYFKENPDYNFIAINGEQTIPEVHVEILQKTGLQNK